MSHQSIEMILAKNLAGYLAVPVFLVSLNGDLVFYNEPAEALLGRRYDETGPMPAAEWSSVFQPKDAAGELIPAEQLPLVIAFSQGRPAHSLMWIDGLDGEPHALEVTAIPMMRAADECVGALAIFWEST